jgi:hypothetical protein
MSSNKILTITACFCFVFGLVAGFWNPMVMDSSLICGTGILLWRFGFGGAE